MRQNNYDGALQHPIGSGFDVASTASDVIKDIDLSGKTAIVTGGYAGIGLETVKAFVDAGAHVIVPARNLEKAKQNLAGIDNVEIESMDLMDPDTIHAFAQNFLDSDRSLELLINNAGIMWVPLQRDARGYESQLSTNHLGHFQLTALLWPALVKAKRARVVNVSSWGHHYSPFNFEDPNFTQRTYETLLGYGQSKTANILFTTELDKRGRRFGVQSFSLHPGAIADTDLKRHLTNEELQNLGVFDSNNKVIHDPEKGLKNLQQGASTTVWCATSPQLDQLSGVYCENTDIALVDKQANKDQGDFAERMKDIRQLIGVADFALNEAYAKQLWTLSEKLTEVSFNI